MKKIAIFLIALIPSIALAQYKCTNGGKSYYSDHPCGRDAAYVGQSHDAVSRQATDEATRRYLRDRRERNIIESQETARMIAGQQAVAAGLAAEQREKQIASADRSRKCATAQRELKWDSAAVTRYRDYGWHGQMREKEVAIRQGSSDVSKYCD